MCWGGRVLAYFPTHPCPSCVRTSVHAVLVAMACWFAGGCGPRIPTPSGEEAILATEGLTKEELPLTCGVLEGYWQEADRFFDDTQKWYGSTVVIAWTSSELVLATNQHCLGLSDLAEGDMFTDGIPEIRHYRLTVRFGRKKVPVRYMAVPEHRSADVALLTVDASGLSKGEDYVVAPVLTSSRGLSIGSEVAAVGNPLDPLAFERTVTFGRVSAIRAYIPRLRIIQHDGLVNPGNSGGPLFVNTEDGWFCVGVNFAHAGTGTGISMAYHLWDALRLKYPWVSADAAGAADVIQAVFGREVKLDQ